MLSESDSLPDRASSSSSGPEPRWTTFAAVAIFQQQNRHQPRETVGEPRHSDAVQGDQDVQPGRGRGTMHHQHNRFPPTLSRLLDSRAQVGLDANVSAAYISLLMLEPGGTLAQIASKKRAVAEEEEEKEEEKEEEEGPMKSAEPTSGIIRGPRHTVRTSPGKREGAVEGRKISECQDTEDGEEEEEEEEHPSTQPSSCESEQSEA
ncbi:hypothetical protein EYF80_024165 [Liparis tanakae]|uniref:Uncharacterized protein n=1 Tax=Liparis tanakae TaxID=230148 RepID=A0A4Z2HIK2_9TELE|nr:hypothetical protein EYF80_024165 [Liparis tanakae]